MPKPNDTIGPYTLVRRLGRGSFGVVWLAEKRSQIVTTHVALKISYDDEIDLEPIRKEARIWLQAGGHPNIVRFIDADVYDNQPVIVSEYAPDGSLTDWLARHGGKAPSVERALAIIDGVLAGLEHLHAKGIIHRDLKPDNILLEGEVARLADFGIARVLESTGAHTTRVAGTPKYMAPESFRGKRSGQTDIWSTGIVLYQLLTGTCPFDGEDSASLMYAILDQAYPALPDDVPIALKSIVARSLEKNPDARYQTAEEMRVAVRKLTKARPGTRRVISSPDEPTLVDIVPSPLTNDEQTLIHSQQFSLKKRIRGATLDSEVSSDSAQIDTRVELLRSFWEGFESRRIIVANTIDLNSPFIPATGGGKSWRVTSLGNGFKLAAQVNASKRSADVNITVGSRGYLAFCELYTKRDQIERAISSSIDWKLNAKGESWVTVRGYFDISDRTNWEQTYDWLWGHLKLFHEVMSPIISNTLSRIVVDNGEEKPTKPDDQGSGWEFTNPALLDTKRAEISASFARTRGLTLTKRSRALYWSSDKSIRVGCTISKRYAEGMGTSYWYAYHPRWDNFLGEAKTAFLLLGCMDLNFAFAIPLEVLRGRLHELNLTPRPQGKSYWHLKIIQQESGYALQMPKSNQHLPLAKYRVETNHS